MRRANENPGIYTDTSKALTSRFEEWNLVMSSRTASTPDANILEASFLNYVRRRGNLQGWSLLLASYIKSIMADIITP